jgi:urocanate hydratase
MAEGKVSDYIVLSRDHHDVSGTDSPFRETSNIYDGSAFTAGREGLYKSLRVLFYLFIFFFSCLK